MSPTNRNRKDKGKKDQSKNMRKELIEFVSKYKGPAPKSKVKKGLFQKGFRTEHYARKGEPTDNTTLTRLHGNLDDIISVVNGKAPAAKYEDKKTTHKSRSKHQHKKHDLSNAESKGKETSLPHASSWVSPDNSPKFFNDFSGQQREVHHDKENIQSQSRNLENLSNTHAVKKARTAAFVNSLPSVYNEAGKRTPPDSGREAFSPSVMEDLRGARMEKDFDAHISLITGKLVNLKRERYGRNDYNTDLKNSIFSELNELWDSSSSTPNVFPGRSPSPKSSPPSRHVQFNSKDCSRIITPNVLYSPSVSFSPPKLSPELNGDPFMGVSDLLVDSQSSSGQGDVQSMTSQRFSSLPYTSEPYTSQQYTSQSYTSQPYTSQQFFPQPFASQMLFSDPNHVAQTSQSSAPIFRVPFAPQPQRQIASLPNPQLNPGFSNTEFKSSTSFAPLEKPMNKEFQRPQVLSSLQFPPTPEFKFYPRNMF